jgi:hypothetical protein
MGFGFSGSRASSDLPRSENFNPIKKISVLTDRSNHEKRRGSLPTSGDLRQTGLPADGDRINAVLAAAGYNFSLLLRWFRRLLSALFLIHSALESILTQF